MKFNVEARLGAQVAEVPYYYNHIHSSSINMKAHPVDFLQAVNEIPETNFVTNN